ncbi:MAG: hypothetical protein P8Y97_06850 [Candidatus Lokiarchaeota archaeon]
MLLLTSLKYVIAMMGLHGLRPSSSKSWILSNGDGVSKIVYYEIKDNAGLVLQTSDIIGLDTEEPLGSIQINGGSLWTTSNNVILGLSFFDATSGIAGVRYSNDNFTWTEWGTPNATKDWILPDGDGPIKIVYYEIKDNVGFIGKYTDTIGLDTIGPNGSITINQGNAWASSTSVILTLEYNDATSGVDKVRYSNDGSSWTIWENPISNKDWVLSPGEGIKFVYYEIRDKVGFITQYNDTIELDTSGPTGSIIINDNDAWTTLIDVNLTLSYSDASSGIDQVRYSNDGTSWTSWEIPMTYKSWILSGGDGFKIVYYEIRNNAGKTSIFSDSIGLDTIGPTGSIQINSGNEWTTSFIVSLSLTYNDASSGVTEVRYSNDGSSWTAWEDPMNLRTWILSGIDGSKAVYYEIKDNVGFISQYTDIIGLDTNNPTGSIKINDDDLWTNSTTVNLSLTYNDATSGVYQVRFSNDGSSWTSWENPTASRAWILSDVDGVSKPVYYEIRDYAGRISQFVDFIGLDTIGPIGSIKINNNDLWTSSPNVILTLTYNDATSGVDKVRYSNDAISWSTWETPSLTKLWILSDGDGPSKIVYFEIRDIIGRISRFSDTIGLDTLIPIIIINLPTNNTYWNLPPDINIGVFDINFESFWYECDGKFVPLINNTVQTLDNSIWTNLAQGEFTIRVFANDSAGNLNINNLKLYKDTIAPKILVNTPQNRSTWKNPPLINITAIDPNLNNIWYKVGSSGRIFLTNNVEQPLIGSIWNSLPEGEFILEIYANDGFGYLNDTVKIVLYKDTVAPGIIIHKPEQGSYWDEPPILNAELLDNNGGTLWYGDGITNIVLQNNTDQTLDLEIWNRYGDGLIQIYVYANDSAGNVNATIILNIYKDISAPTLIINSPENIIYWNNAPFINIEALDPTLNTIWYKVGSFPIVFLVNNANQELDENIWTSLPEGEFILEIFADDAFGHLNDTIKLTLYKDTITPEIIVNKPADGLYWNSPPLLNIVSKDTNEINLWYSDGIDDIMLLNNTDQFIDSIIWDRFDNGLNLLYIYAIDIAGNINDSFVIEILKDTLGPTIVIDSPQNNTYSNTPPSLKVISYDPNFETLWYEYQNLKIPLSNDSYQVLETSIWNILEQGKYSIHIFANDTFGQTNHIVLELFKDTKAPLLVLNYPENMTYWSTPPPMRVTAYDPNLNLLYYTVGISQEVLLNNTEQVFSPSIWDNLDQGEFTITFYAWDSFGYLNNSVKLTLYKDTVAPEIYTISPVNESNCNGPPSLKVIVMDPNLDIIWYDIDGNLVELENNTIQTLETTIWNNLPEGEFIIEVYANDTFGLINKISLILYKDSIKPEIKINFPMSNDIFGSNSPTYDISINESHMDRLWYQLYNGIDQSEKIFITELKGKIDQSLWNVFWNGSVFIRFYINDTANNIVYDEVLVRKDIYAPIITVIDPISPSIFGNKAPNFTLYVDGSFIDKTWYTIDFKPKKYFFIGLTGTISQEAWDLMGNGNFAIHFYINDTLNNIGSDYILITKDIRTPFISINHPTNNTVWNNPPSINISVLDVHLDCIWYEIHNTNIQILTDLLFSIDDLIWDDLSQGDFKIYICANDTAGNLAIRTLYLSKDTLSPIITIISPENNETFDRQAPTFELEIFDPNLASCWYTIDGGLINITFLGNDGKINQTLWEQIWDTTKNGGNIIIRFYANDSLGQIGFKEVRIIKFDDRRTINVLKILDDNKQTIFFGLSIGGIGIVIGASNNLKYNTNNKKKEKRKIGKIFALCLLFLGLDHTANLKANLIIIAFNWRYNYKY